MDVVPAPEAGNALTPRQYQRMWLGTYAQVAQRTGAETITLPEALSDEPPCQARLIVITSAAGGTPFLTETVGAAMGYNPETGLITTQAAPGCPLPKLPVDGER
jgi:hypothetical protein